MSADITRRRLLVAQDNAVNRRVAVRMLTTMRYEVDVVSNGQEAVEALRHRSYDAVLMDCQMPVMDGYAASRAIRAFEGQTRRTPIIAVTAGAMVGDRDRCLDAGMDAYVTKPVDWQHLGRTLDRWLDASGDAHALASAHDRGEPNAGSKGQGTLDPRILADLQELETKTGGIANVVATFRLDSDEQMRELAQAVTRADVDAVARLSHSLKGSSAMVGAIRVQQVCTEIEDHVAHRGAEGLADALQPLAAALADAHAALGREFPSH